MNENQILETLETGVPGTLVPWYTVLLVARLATRLVPVPENSRESWSIPLDQVENPIFAHLCRADPNPIPRGNTE